ERGYPQGRALETDRCGVRSQEMTDSVFMASKIQLWPIGKLKPYARNPLDHSPQQISKLAKSVKTFGFIIPILAKSDGEIIAGHARHLAALKLKMAKVPVVIADHLKASQIAAFRIAENRLQEDGQWNDFNLAHELASLKKSVLGDDLDVVGFSPEEIKKYIGGGDISGEAATVDVAGEKE